MTNLVSWLHVYTYFVLFLKIILSCLLYPLKWLFRVRGCTHPFPPIPEISFSYQTSSCPSPVILVILPPSPFSPPSLD
uniref:Uncharacterized protein n=1 Tax=Octopus bimaculoides TaxID=37653 RepID=A0A0L8GWT0_OCTBM